MKIPTWNGPSIIHNRYRARNGCRLSVLRAFLQRNDPDGSQYGILSDVAVIVHSGAIRESDRFDIIDSCFKELPLPEFLTQDLEVV